MWGRIQDYWEDCGCEKELPECQFTLQLFMYSVWGKAECAELIYKYTKSFSP